MCRRGVARELRGGGHAPCVMSRWDHRSSAPCPFLVTALTVAGCGDDERTTFRKPADHDRPGRGPDPGVRIRRRRAAWCRGTWWPCRLGWCRGHGGSKGGWRGRRVAAGGGAAGPGPSGAGRRLRSGRRPSGRHGRCSGRLPRVSGSGGIAATTGSGGVPAPHGLGGRPAAPVPSRAPEVPRLRRAALWVPEAAPRTRREAPGGAGGNRRCHSSAGHRRHHAPPGTGGSRRSPAGQRWSRWRRNRREAAAARAAARRQTTATSSSPTMTLPWSMRRPARRPT